MNPVLRNVLAVIAGVFIGGLLNSLIVTYAPVPEGVNPNDLESINANIGSYPIHFFLSPFLAHALGTLLGAFLASKLSASHHRIFALSIGIFFMIGGVMAVFMIKAPTWFAMTDLILAYLPMGYLGWKLSGKPATV